MPMYNLIEYIYNYSDTLESLCQSKRDELTLTNAGYPESSHQKCSLKYSVLRNFANFTGKHLRPYEFYKIPFLQNTSGRLFLNITANNST